ncbi:MAG TPA: heme-copper oxidase subunit III [Candidatus Kapabacteria bacterium]|jgi:heme/copper-type cytochrome/quinol oxidase subunit 3|nr:heme-copper oxidase subunit III [Candidatus Kapabacteria bacterium]
MSQTVSLEHTVDPRSAHHPVVPGRFIDANTLSDTPTRVANWKMFMWLFLAQDAMMFFTMFAGYLALRISSTNWQDPDAVLNIPMTAIATFDLIVSSVTMVQAIAAIQRGDRKKMRMWLGLTVLGGVLFLGFQAWEYSHLIGVFGMGMSRSLFDATFFILTGFHGLHVFAGVVYLSSVLLKSKRYTSENYTHIEVAGLYWHFVDLVWIILFTLVYLI